MIIGLNGQLGSGKDTVYERAVALYGESWIHRISFADKLKQSAAALLGVTPTELNWWKNSDNVRLVIEDRKSPTKHIVDMNFRTYLQRYGTEAHRDVFADDFWVDAALPLDFWEKVNNTQGVLVGETFFVTDARFPNEIERIKALGGKIWRVHGPNDVKDVAHASEQILPDELVDVEIDNTRRDDNFRQLDAVIRRLLESKSLYERGLDPLNFWEKA